MTLAHRIERLRPSLADQQLDALLVTDETNVRYLTGFTGDSSYLLLTARGATMLSDRRYEEQLATECPGLDAAIRGPGKTMHALVVEAVERGGAKRLGLEQDHLSWGAVRKLSADLEGVELVGTSSLVEHLRQCKDGEELEILRRAVRIAERAFRAVRAELRAGMTERDVAHLLEQRIRWFGGEGCGFPPIVAVGASSALPHYRPGENRIGDHPLVLIDWGARYAGYTSDMTRMLVTGPIEPELRRAFEVVDEAVAAAVAAIAPGAVLEEVDRAARRVIEEAGLGDYFSHGLGHGIGLEVHESPRVAVNQRGTLEPGMVVTVEPGIYRAGRGGIRLEEDVLVTERGASVLSSLPRGLEAAEVLL